MKAAAIGIEIHHPVADMAAVANFFKSSMPATKIATTTTRNPIVSIHIQSVAP